jgi:uncharacterized membrane protein
MFGLLFMLLFWGGLIALGVWLISALFPRDGRRSTSPSGRDLSARQILDQRYAQGEITREQHELMKQDLG